MALMSNRPEDGPMRFGNDWTGVFIRGDTAYHYGVHLERILAAVATNPDFEVVISRAVVEGLLSDLRGSNEHEANQEERQNLRSFDDCLATPLCSGCMRSITGPHACPGPASPPGYTVSTTEEEQALLRELPTIPACLRPYVEEGKITPEEARKVVTDYLGGNKAGAARFIRARLDLTIVETMNLFLAF